MNKIKKYLKITDLNTIITNRLIIITFLIVLFFLIILIRLIILQIGNVEEYRLKLTHLTSKVVEGPSVPRGRIYDRNFNIIVDNIGYKTIYYQKPKGVSIKDEINLAYTVGKILELSYDKLSVTELKEFWLLLNKEAGNKKITDQEYEALKMRELTKKDLHDLKKDRITKEELERFDNMDLRAAYLYYLMNQGYYYEKKIIKDDNVSDEEYAYISENIDKYQGFNTELDWKRQYVYDDTIRQILGNVSTSEQGIPFELKDYYLDQGYSLNDRVGISYLEYIYEDLLRGEKSLYRVNQANDLELENKGIRGHDLVLTIDINLQIAIEKILIEEMIKAKKEPNTDYYNKSVVLVGNPKTGEILAYAAKQIIEKNGEYNIYDYTPFIATSPIVVGSVIKGSSMAVGYNTGVIDIDTKMLDECIKIRHTPLKCSWKKGLGVLNDIDALKLSSNSYQFKTAMKVAGVNYKYDGGLKINSKVFDLYRDMFAEFGLGVKTGIDFSVESLGYKGKSDISGHLLDFVIGQYDTYTSLQLLQYINTIANGGNRYKLNLLKQVHQPTTKEELGLISYEIKPTVLNKLNLETKYMNRIQEGFIAVMNGTLGYNYMGNVLNPAGKTGTSESFIDTTGDGKIDKETISKTFVGYFPADDPIVSIVVISPDISHRYYNSTYTSLVNTKITRRVSEKIYEMFF